MISRRVFRSVGDGGRAWQESRRQTLSLGGLLESRGVGDTVQEEAVRVLQRCGFVATHELTSFMSSQVRSVDGACHGMGMLMPGIMDIVDMIVDHHALH